jgi:hypothetical protein
VPFDPGRIPDDSCVEGHLDGDPIYDVLMSVHRAKATGRLTVEDAAGANHMFFMQGRPVGVALAEYVHPLGQLLLELGRVNGATFVRAQRLIAEGNRLAGQVFKELGILDEDGLRDVLAIQARKKAEHFCRLGSRPFLFCRGLSYLMGFTSTPLEMWVVVFLAVRSQLGPDARAAWIEGARDLQVRIQNAPGDETGLPAPLEAFGFGAAEERFLQRIVGGWEKVTELCDTGTLPPDEAAVLLRFLEIIGRLDKRAMAPVPAQVSAVTRPLREAKGLAVPESLDDVFSSGPAGASPTPASAAPPAHAHVPAQAPAPASAPAPAPAPRVAAPPASPDSVFAGPNERTDPRRRSIHDQATVPLGNAELPPPPVAKNGARNPDRPRFRSVLFPEPEQNAPPPPSVVVSEELPAPVVRKKKVKRTEPLPSEGSGVLVSETRKEKTQVGPVPTIVIDED